MHAPRKEGWKQKQKNLPRQNQNAIAFLWKKKLFVRTIDQNWEKYLLDQTYENNHEDN